MDYDIDELATALVNKPSRKQWKLIIQAFAFKNSISLKEALKIVKENMDYIKEKRAGG